MPVIKASAPGKLMLFGEHAVVYGFPSIVTAVDQRIYVEVETTKEEMLILQAAEVGQSMYQKKMDVLGKGEIPKSVSFVEALVANFKKQFAFSGGLRVKTRSEFSPLYGFGSSSAVTVALAAAMAEAYGIKLENKQLFDLCYKTVIDVQGVGSGFDVAAAIWGGTIYYVKPAKVVTLLTQSELPLVVGYSGVKADTTKIVKMVAKKRESNKQEIDSIFAGIEVIVGKAKDVLMDQDWKHIGELMNENQKLLARLGVSSPKLDALISGSTEAGALGAKLSGAGGGDCMIAVATSNTSKVAKAITKAGGQVVDVRTSAAGVRIEKS